MPFTNQPSYHYENSPKNILFLSVDNTNIHPSVFSLAQYAQEQGLSPLFVEGNLGVSLSDKIYIPLEKVLKDKASISKAIQHIQQISVLGGKASEPLSVKSKNFQNQFLTDLNILSGNFDKTIVSLVSDDPNLQELWLSWADKKYLFFQTKNIYLEKVARFLHEYPNQIDALISLDDNPHLSRLAWLRLKKIIPDLPELCLNKKQTVQK